MQTPTLDGYLALLNAALARSPACVGLDPVLENLPEPVRAAHWEAPRAIEHFCRGVLDAVALHVAIVKPQSACFERHGSAGVAVLERLVRHARDLGLLVILDAKRGDIGVSAAHYAAAAGATGAHAVTVNAYLGTETVQPYLDAGLGVFVLVRTSNPGGDQVQAQPLATGQTVAEMMATNVRTLGDAALARLTTPSALSPVGAVVGATKADEGIALRRLMPDTPFLVPGYGAQGGTAQDVRRLIRPAPGNPGVIVNSSRGVLYPKPIAGERWEAGVARAARDLALDLSRALSNPA